MGRRQGREAALKTLFQVELGGVQPEFALRTTCEEDKVPSADAGFARELVTGVLSRLNEVDQIIGRFSSDWSVERMPAVDRVILRVACFELMFRPDIPVAVAISEAVELAKKYSTPEAGRFINGVLSAVARLRSAKDGRV
ncbi:MAG: transcription antitermination protein NusB [Bacillota bacterium]|nr:transcription antitermination protein NusB [Bacillota bacterium]MDK2924654.1 transcription antitermination protein NusB [Bacillota bacterium]MDK2960772.1 transcription antitermination protein NusB [Bacillota bacterium]